MESKLKHRASLQSNILPGTSRCSGFCPVDGVQCQTLVPLAMVLVFSIVCIAHIKKKLVLWENRCKLPGIPEDHGGNMWYR